MYTKFYYLNINFFYNFSTVTRTLNHKKDVEEKNESNEIVLIKIRKKVNRKITNTVKC